MRTPEIERSPFHRRDFPGGDAERIDGKIGRCFDPHRILLHRAVSPAAEAEERMVGDIHGRRPVRGGFNVHVEGAFRVQRIAKVDVQVSGIAFQPVRVQQMQADGSVRHLRHIPHQIVDSDEAAVQGVYPVVIRGGVIGNAVHAELRAADAVGHWAHRSAQEAFSRRRHVILQIVMTHHDVLPVPVTVFGKSGHHAGPEIGELHRNVPVLEGV